MEKISKTQTCFTVTNLILKLAFDRQRRGHPDCSCEVLSTYLLKPVAFGFLKFNVKGLVVRSGRENWNDFDC